MEGRHEEEQRDRDNVQIESCIAFSQLDIQLLFVILGFSRLAPPSGLRGSCVEAILLSLCDMLMKGRMPAQFPVTNTVRASMPRGAGRDAMMCRTYGQIPRQCQEVAAFV